ncbi:MAG: DUF234 domain-containing protein [Muribaculaceae bacterium]|nr:DUF234 domain-containing protein [Muribaculaceae bacterium]
MAYKNLFGVKHVSTLRSIKLIERVTPCGDGDSSKKSLYKIADNYYLFWYKFIFSNMSYYELLDAPEAAEEIMRELPSYMGGIFENICLQYMIRLAKMKKLPFVPHSIGRWWGANPHTKKAGRY